MPLCVCVCVCVSLSLFFSDCFILSLTYSHTPALPPKNKKLIMENKSHNMGLKHDRGVYNNCGDGIGYNYGYRDTQNNFRSIMAYPCSSYPGCDTPVGGSCSLVGRFSNINSPYNGKPFGSSEANNAKV